MVLCIGVKILTGLRLFMPSSPPIIAQGSAAGIKSYALVDACGGRIPCLDEISCIPGGSFSIAGRPIAMKNVTGCQEM